MITILTHLRDSTCKNCGQPISELHDGGPMPAEWFHQGDLLEQHCAGSPVAEPIDD